MKTRTVLRVISIVALALLSWGVWAMWQRTSFDIGTAAAVNRTPNIRPGYRDTVVPPNIAPLNFVVEEPGTHYRVRIHSTQGSDVIDVTSRSAKIKIPLTRWRQLLQQNRGRKLYFDIYVRGRDRTWSRFASIENTIADADIDNYLFYRLMKPIYILGINMGIYQRDVRTFKESVVVHNRAFKGGCINCHAFAPNHPDRMLLQSRDVEERAYRRGMIVAQKNQAVKVDTRRQVRDPESDRGRVRQSLAGYVSWHPNGRVVAYSANHISQFFHVAGENRDVFDSESDLALYHIDSNTATTAPSISRPDRLETFPSWSPDGRFLYFSSAVPRPRERYREVRYDLMRARYDADTRQFGDAEPMLLAKDTGLSITEPRISPDGRWVLVCMSEYGAFPVYQRSSDLYLMNLQTREYRRLDVNTHQCESWHCWSSNSRWIAFASKRRDGLFGCVYFSYVDENGRVSQPLLLPQQDPTFYDRLLRTYNAPELSRWPAPVEAKALARAIQEREPLTATR